MDKGISLYLPEPIMRFIAKCEAMPNDRKMKNEYIGKFKRMCVFSNSSYENCKKINKAWKTLERYAINDSNLVSLFISLPSSVSRHPYKNLFYPRIQDPAQEKQELEDIIESLRKVRHFFRNPCFSIPRSINYKLLLADVQATNTHECSTARNEFMEIETQFKQGLFKLENLLKSVDTWAKYTGKQWYTNNAAKHAYLVLIAELNIHLTKPQHAALAVVANANIPSTQVNREEIRKAYERRTNYAENC